MSLIALDIDGTVVDFDGNFTPEVQSRVLAAIDQGHQVVLATGRPLVATLPVARTLGLRDAWLVCSNGSVTARITPLGTSVIEDAQVFDPRPAIPLMEEFLGGSQIALEDVGRGYWVTGPFPTHLLHGEHTHVPLAELSVSQTVRIVVADAPERNLAFQNEMQTLGLQDTYFGFGHSLWMDIAPIGVTKASALEKLRQAWGVSADDTVAVGDGENDIEMLQWAGRGVAMGHAVPELLTVADAITGTIAEDGLCAVLDTVLDVPKKQLRV